MFRQKLLDYCSCTKRGRRRADCGCTPFGELPSAPISLHNALEVIYICCNHALRKRGKIQPIAARRPTPPPTPRAIKLCHPIVPTSVFSQGTAHGTRRSLAVAGPAKDPNFYPNGGTYYDPIAVSLVSDDDAVVFYTTDGTAPDGASSFVTSSELIILEDSATIRAMAAYGREYFDAYSSAEVEATFAVYTKGVSARPKMLWLTAYSAVGQCSGGDWETM